MRGFLIVTLAIVGSVGVASAQQSGQITSNSERCFDKGTLTYFECPKAEQAPTPLFPAPVAAAPVVAPLVDDRGFYLGGRGGLMWPDDTEFSITNNNVENGYDMGYAIGGVAGYDFGEVTPGLGLRTELEIGYQAAEVDQHTLANGGNVAGSTGDTDVLYGFVNAYGDIGLAPALDLVLGGGIGAGQVSFDGHGGSGGVIMDDDDTVFGFHLDAGLAYDIIPELALEAMYRYSSFIDAELTSNAAGGNVSSTVDVDSHQALVGLRYKF